MILAALAAAGAVTAASPPADAPDCDAARHALFLYMQRAPLGTKTPPIVCHDGKVVAMPAEVAAAIARPSLPQPEDRLNLYRAPGPECGPIERKVLEDQKEQFRKLGRLPNGFAQYAVLRQVDGCTVPAPIGYHPPALPGAADNPPPTVKREDAPSNRR